MPKYIDISNWNHLEWYNTGGTRSKKYLNNPTDQKNYFFKKSAEKYPFEFWSEIIAYEIGKMVRLNILRYDVAYFNDEIGCISESMINPDKEELIEGGKLLQSFDNTFSPEDKSLRAQYTFQLIDGALQFLKLDGHIDKILEIIVFDALIGNGDRHQENWAFIGEYSALSKSVSEIEYDIKSLSDLEKFPRALKSLMKKILFTERTGKTIKRPEMTWGKLTLHKNVRFAPIYDNGSSLSRECTPEKIEGLLKNSQEVDAYLRKGVAEIHWEEEKTSHFNLIKNILQTSYEETLKKIIKQVVENYNSTEFEQIIVNLDRNLPVKFNSVKIPEQRKRLIISLVNLRAQKLRDFLK
jgi:hypothetical protein